jgi:hypothetical protein
MTMGDNKSYYLAYCICVESGKIVQSSPPSPDLERKTFDEFSRWVESAGGWILPVVARWLAHMRGPIQCPVWYV